MLNVCWTIDLHTFKIDRHVFTNNFDLFFAVIRTSTPELKICLAQPEARLSPQISDKQSVSLSSRRPTEPAERLQLAARDQSPTLPGSRHVYNFLDIFRPPTHSLTEPTLSLNITQHDSYGPSQNPRRKSSRIHIKTCAIQIQMKNYTCHAKKHIAINSKTNNNQSNQLLPALQHFDSTTPSLPLWPNPPPGIIIWTNLIRPYPMMLSHMFQLSWVINIWED